MTRETILPPLHWSAKDRDRSSSASRTSCSLDSDAAHTALILHALPKGGETRLQTTTSRRMQQGGKPLQIRLVPTSSRPRRVNAELSYE
jgi:hypothetical protein